jgi:hypothetical protein
MDMDSEKETILSFCKIQLQLLKNRQTRLRKEILECKMQEEFLLSTLSKLESNKK